MIIYHYIGPANAAISEYIILSEDDDFDIAENARPGFHLDAKYLFEGDTGSLPLERDLVSSL